MAYQPLNDLIDPDVSAEGEASPEQAAPETGDETPVIGEDGRALVNLEISEALGRKHPAPKPWVKPAAIALLVVFAGLTAWNLAHLGQVKPIVSKPTLFQVKQALYLGALKVEAYRKVHGATPASLIDAGIPDDAGYAYSRTDPGRYVLVFEADGQRVEYDSVVELERFFGTPQQMLTMGGSR
jgi:hypothetical protein